jgi:hypothetical protein
VQWGGRLEHEGTTGNPSGKETGVGPHCGSEVTTRWWKGGGVARRRSDGDDAFRWSAASQGCLYSLEDGRGVNGDDQFKKNGGKGGTH